MIRIPLSDARCQVNGLPWFGGGRFHRLPEDIRDRVSADLWACAGCTSGARVRFRTDSSTVGVCMEMPGKGESNNMSVYGRCGLDAYADGAYWNTVLPGGSGVFERPLFEFARRQPREIVLYLPTYSEAAVKGIFIDDYSRIEPPAPFALDKPVVFYGTSITMGGCASRPALTYPALIGRALNVDFVNLGFSGLGRGEPAVAEAAARIDAACFVIDMGQNNPHLSELYDVFEPFYRTLREGHPDTPIIMTTPLFNTFEHWNDATQAQNRKRREHMRLVYERSGDPHLHLLEWTSAIDMTDGDGFVDFAHPNDVGFVRMKEGMLPVLARVLGLGQRNGKG